MSTGGEVEPYYGGDVAVGGRGGGAQVCRVADNITLASIHNNFTMMYEIGDVKTQK